MFTQQLPLNQQIALCAATLSEQRRQRAQLQRQLWQHWQTPVLALTGLWTGSLVAAHLEPAAAAQRTVTWQTTSLCLATCHWLSGAAGTWSGPHAPTPSSVGHAPLLAKPLGALAIWLAWYNKPAWWWELWRWLRSHRPRPPSKTPTIAHSASR